MSEQLIISLVAVVIVIIVGFPVHEFSHAWAAYRLGDSTARYLGRLTLNPRAHFDPLGSAILVISAFFGFFIGWAKPTPVNPYNLAYGRRGEAIVALAGPVSNLVMAAAAAIPVRVIASSPELLRSVAESPALVIVYDVLWFFVAINVLLFIFNLLPVPPLDGWKLLLGLVDARTAYTLRQFEQYAMLALLALFIVGPRIIGPIWRAVNGFFVGPAFPLPLQL